MSDHTTLPLLNQQVRIVSAASDRAVQTAINEAIDDLTGDWVLTGIALTKAPWGDWYEDVYTDHLVAALTFDRIER